MLERLRAVNERYEELNRRLATPEIATNPDAVRELARECAELEPLVGHYRHLLVVAGQLQQAQEILRSEADPELLELARQEVSELSGEREHLEHQLELLLLPPDPLDQKDVIVEVRAGPGGEEAALFAAELARMYMRYAEGRGWETEIVSSNGTGIGGYKEVVFTLRGMGAYSRLKHESGVHRVQRVPRTEASGRIHTSTATVAVLPETETVEVDIAPNDLLMDVFRSSGPGGQHMQKNSTAVRLIHKPTGMVVSCQSERSQVQNRARCMSILRSRLYAMELEKRDSALDAERRSQVGTAERSEKIRTYNFPQNRVTDHRFGLTSHRLTEVLDGSLDEFIDALIEKDQEERLRELLASETTAA